MFFFFFQAEDGIRDLTVTGVQTCALPISRTVTLARIPVSFGKQKSPRNATPRALTTTTSVVCMFNTRRRRWMRQGAAMGKIRVGILGATGTIGQRFLQLLERHPRFSVTALAASDR